MHIDSALCNKSYLVHVRRKGMLPKSEFKPKDTIFRVYTDLLLISERNCFECKLPRFQATN